MSTLIWPNDKDPDDLAEYSIDWTKKLAGDSIVSSTWQVPADLLEGNKSHTANTATIWLSGGIDGRRYVLVNRVVTQQGRIFDEGVILNVVSAGKERPVGPVGSAFEGIDLSDPCTLWPKMQAALDQLLIGESVVRIRFQGHETEFARANIGELRSRIDELKALCDATNGRVRRRAIRGGFRCL